MRQELIYQNIDDPEGRPWGGTVTGEGIEIRWQQGPLGRGDSRVEPNGAFVEGVIQAAIYRLEYYQASEFMCKENEKALWNLREALIALESRTSRRETAGVEGTHEGN